MELKTFPGLLNTNEIKEDTTKPNNNYSKPTKEQIINQAFKCHSKGDISEASKYYQYFLDQGFKDPRVFTNYGVILKQTGQKEKAIELYKKSIELFPNISDAYSNLGNILKELGKLQDAEFYLRKAIELKPDLAEAHNNLGSVLKELGNLRDAEELTRKAIKLNPNFVEAYINLSNILIDIGGLEEAGKSIRRAIELKPNYAEAHFTLGNFLITISKVKEAEESIRKAIELKPNYAEAYFNLGNLMIDIGSLNEAEIYIRKAIKLKSDMAQSYSSLGFILLNLGKLKDVELNLRKAIDLNPDISTAHRYLSIYLYIKGDKNSALKSIEKSYLIDPSCKNTRLLLNIFKREIKNKSNDFNLGSHKINFTFSTKKINPLIQNRPVEGALIDTLYKLKARNQKDFQIPTYGNTSGSDYNLFEGNKNEPIIQALKIDLYTILKEAINSEILIDDSFFTIFRSGGGLVSHNHLGTLDKINDLNLSKKKFSLVYYLSIGDQDCDEPGILKLEDPKQDILPHNGMVIIFPAWRNHSVFYKGKKDRIIIGVNCYGI